MVKMTLDIEGMACGMCEAHINDAIRKAFPVKKVNSSHKKNQTIIVTESEISEKALKEIIDPTGYKILSVMSEPYEKHGIFSI